MIITILIALIFTPLLIHKLKWNAQEEEKDTPFTDTSIHYLIAVFISIIASLAIALEADIPASAGHGGFLLLIGPAFFGIVVMSSYVASLYIFPKKKVILGLTAILINLGIGSYYLFNGI